MPSKIFPKIVPKKTYQSEGARSVRENALVTASIAKGFERNMSK